MRVMLRFAIPVEKGNLAIQDGSMGKAFQALEQKFKPEAAYFYVDAGKRAGLYIFDISDPSQLLESNEPLFSALDAEVDIKVVLTANDLQKGIRNVTP